ncbi:ABC transporter substrate-binding protein [Parafannyhessea umbonata]|uniref:Amino acid ABC transporter substrate-binding protein, PAAT family n=1 Tax=Parafannyhessea umbonata TaxID=604330 RepID=A0A1H9P650_9ACTN|nr:ABC transporter substrate-binding protein [Parafannyhessea umbonata]SER43670.1 amino acid ABC transporter substrate-binding protein, PAAT family [Parafannyhessea umbonata]
MNSNALSRRNFVQLVGLGLAGMGAAGLAGCAGQSAPADSSAKDDDGFKLVEDGKLTLVSNFYFPPFVSMNEKTGDYEGFDVDLYKAICEKLSLEPNILPTVQFDTIIPTIKQGGKADVSLGAITITDAREQEIDFSDPYLDSNQSIVVRKDATATTTEQLNADGMQIAVQGGTSGEGWAKENLPKATIVPLDDIIQALTGVQSNLYAACITDLPVSSYEIKIAYSDLMIPEGGEIPTGEQYGVVISKDQPGLTKAINKALADIQSDGTMDSLQQKWFGQTL